MARQPNIVLINCDDLGYGDLGCYGSEVHDTPRIDALAGESLIFERVFAGCPYTLCSLPTMFTGLSWTRHGVVEPGDHLDDRHPGMAEILQDAGYLTLGYAANPHHSNAAGLGRGYDEFIELWNLSNTTIDLEGLVISDGDQLDTLTSYEGGTTEVESGEYALIIDPEYADDYSLDSDLVLVTPEDTHLGNSLAVGDRRLSRPSRAL